MMIILTYDVNVTTESGNRRLRKVAKLCENYGIRVQNSVFELLVDNAQFITIKSKILSIIDKDCDSVRYYKLGSNWSNKIEIIGKNTIVQQDGTLIL